jgi:TrmH family RNA methyltransferase
VDASPGLQALTRAQGTLIRHLLHDKKTRTHEGAFVIEGAKSCLDLIGRHPQAILSLTLSTRYLQGEREAERKIRSQLAARQFACSDAVFEKLSDVETPQGMLAVVRQPRWDETRVFGQTRVLGIYGDQVRDPANVGTIIRTAAALNLTGVWLSADSADCFSPKVVRATAGAILTLPIFRTPDIRIFSRHKCSVYSAIVPSPGTIALKSIQKIPHRLVIAVGNEGRGLTPDLVKISDVRFSIPLAREVESLNVAATAAISAFYFSDLPTES